HRRGLDTRLGTRGEGVHARRPSQIQGPPGRPGVPLRGRSSSLRPRNPRSGSRSAASPWQCSPRSNEGPPRRSATSGLPPPRHPLSQLLVAEDPTFCQVLETLLNLLLEVEFLDDVTGR